MVLLFTIIVSLFVIAAFIFAGVLIKREIDYDKDRLVRLFDAFLEEE